MGVSRGSQKFGGGGGRWVPSLMMGRDGALETRPFPMVTTPNLVALGEMVGA